MAGLADILSQAAGPDTTDDTTHTPDPAAAPAATPGLSDVLTQASKGEYTPETPAAPTDHLPPLEGTTVIPAKTTPSRQYGRFTVPEHTDPEHYQPQTADIVNKVGNEATLGTGKYLAAGLGAASRWAQGQDPNFTGQLNDIRQSIHRGEAELGPEQPLVDYGVPAAEALAMGPLMAVERVAAKAIPAAETAIGRVWQAGKKFLAPAVKNATIGATVGATSGAANTEGPNWMDYVYGGERGAAVGAVLGAGIPAVIKGVGALGSAVKGLFGSGNKEWANNAILEALKADGISEVDANRKLAAWVNAGSKPETILDLGGDAMRRLGRVVYTQGGKGASGLEDFLNGRASGRVDRLMGDFGEAAGTPERNVVYEQPRLEAEAGQATAGAQTAARQSFADVAGRPAGTRTVGQEAGATIRTALDTERQRLQQARSQAAGPNYGNVRGSDAAVNTDPVTATFADQMVQHEGTPIGSQLTAAHDLLFTKTPDGVKYRKTSMPQMQGALAAMNDQAYGLGKNTSAGRAVGEMAKTLKTQIDSADTSLQQANAAYRTASTPLAPFNDPQMGHAADILAQDQYRTGHVMPDEQVPARYFNPGKTASSDMQEFRQLAGGNPDAVRAMRSYIADQAQRASQGANGAFDPQAFGQWVAKHQDALRQFPEIAQDLTSWAQAVTAAGNAATGSQPALMLRAITGGRDFLSTDPEQIRAMLQGMSPAEQEMYRQGAMRALRDAMGVNRGGATQVTAAFSGKPVGDNMRNRIAAVFGNEANYQSFAQNAARESAMQRTEGFVTQGTQTANKLQDVAAGIDKGEMAKAIIKRDIGGILTQLLGFGKRVFQASQGFTRGRTAELSKAMQQPLDPSMIQELQGEGARAAAPLVSGAARGAAGLAGAVGPAVAAPGTPGQRGLPGFAAGGLAGGDDRGADEGGPGSAAGEGGASSDAGSAGHGGNYGGRGGGATDRGGDTAGDSGAGLPGGASGAYNSKPNVMSRSPITGQQLERQADFHNVGNSTLDNIGNYAASLLGFNEIDPTLSGRKALAGGTLPGMQADWGFDPAGLIGGVGGAALGAPGLGVVADLVSQRLGRPLETNLGPNVFGGSGSTVATDPSAGKLGHLGGLGRQGLKMAQRMNRGGRAGYAGGGLAGQTLVGPDDTPPDDAAIPARYRDAVGQAQADEFLGQGPLDAIRDFGRDQSAADAANMRIFQAKRAGQEPAQGDWQAVESSPMMNFGMGLVAPDAGGFGTGPVQGGGLATTPTKVAGIRGLENPMPVPEDYTAGIQRGLSRKPDVGGPANPSTKIAPGVHMGDVTLPQWIKRVESNLSPDEIGQARKWYADALPTYEKYFGPEKAPKMMGAWLTGNVNATPSFAQLSATRTLEQSLNKTPEFGVQKQGGLAHDKLMSYWDAVNSGDPSRLKAAGSGQKIYDFIDSALGKDTRTFYGDDPRMGAPTVADVHSLRDMGFVDQAALNWVEKNHGLDAAAKLKRDSEGLSPGEAQYEWTADKMRKFTDQLNKKGYAGGNWTPSEVQAVGWTAMSKMLGRKPETAEAAISSNIRNLISELDFGEGAPYNEQFPDWKTLAPEQKAAVTKEIMPQISDFAKEVTGAHEFNKTVGVGGWHQFTNPSMKNRLIASPEVAGDMADMIGYLAQQTKVFGYRPAPNGPRVGIAIHGEGLQDPATVTKLWSALAEQHPDLAAGFSPSIRPDGMHGIEVIFDKGGKGVEDAAENKFLPAIHEAATKLGISTETKLFRAEEASREHDWKADPTGGQYTSRLGKRYGPDLQNRLELFKRQLEPRIQEAIAKAKGKGVSRQAPQEVGTAPALPGAVSSQGLATGANPMFVPKENGLATRGRDKFMASIIRKQRSGEPAPFDPVDTFMPGPYPTPANERASGGRAVAQAFHEVYHNTPKIVTHTAEKFGAEDARKQRVAIALSKARKAGADV